MIAILMGSDSDLPVVEKAAKILKKFDVKHTMHVISAHRTPDKAHAFARDAVENGYKAFICAAGKAAHLAGVIAAFTTLPVIGLPIKSSTMDGLDSLLSTVQMPSGIPVATVAIDGAENAALLAVQMLAISDENLQSKLVEYKLEMAEAVEAKDRGLHK